MGYIRVRDITTGRVLAESSNYQQMRVNARAEATSNLMGQVVQASRMPVTGPAQGTWPGTHPAPMRSGIPASASMPVMGHQVAQYGGATSFQPQVAPYGGAVSFQQLR